MNTLHTLALSVPHLDVLLALIHAAQHPAPQIIDPSAPVVWSQTWGAGK